MSFEPSNRRWGTLVFIAGIIVLAGITVPWCQMLPGLPWCGSVPASAAPTATQPPEAEAPTTTQPPEAEAPTASPPSNAVEISIYSSDTKEDWLNLVTNAFNEAQIKTSAGRPIFVHVEHVDSGGSKDDILDGNIQPVVWSPGEQSWVNSLNQTWTDRTGRPLIPEACSATVYAPVGFAMFRPMAEAMGWPDQPIGWDEIVALAADPEGWGRYDHPEWGAFKFGHTHPAHSNSGLLLLVALAHSVLDTTGGLTVEQVKSPAFVEALRTVEQHIAHYGRRSRENTFRMVQNGQAFLHATNTSEAEALRTNSGVYGEPVHPLAFIIPADGTFWADHPYCILDGDWVSDEQAEAARLYRDYLLAPAQQALAPANYLRPVDPSIPLSGPFTIENGTDPRVTPSQVPALESPAPEVTGAIKDVWIEVKKKASIVMVLDTSSSMEGDQLRDAIQAVVTALKAPDRLYQDDWLVIMQFSDQPMELEPAGRVGDVSERLIDVVGGLYADGGTALHDAVCQAAERLAEQQAADLAAGDLRLYAVVVLSDGDNTSGQRSENDMFNCLPAGEEVQGLRVFTIAYGEDANTDVLLRLANRTGGKFYEASPESILTILLEILVQ
jgi:Ca-activated chloride channel homolog